MVLGSGDYRIEGVTVGLQLRAEVVPFSHLHVSLMRPSWSRAHGVDCFVLAPGAPLRTDVEVMINEAAAEAVGTRVAALIPALAEAAGALARRLDAIGADPTFARISVRSTGRELVIGGGRLGGRTGWDLRDRGRDLAPVDVEPHRSGLLDVLARLETLVTSAFPIGAPLGPPVRL